MSGVRQPQNPGHPASPVSLGQDVVRNEDVVMAANDGQLGMCRRVMKGGVGESWVQEAGTLTHVRPAIRELI